MRLHPWGWLRLCWEADPVACVAMPLISAGSGFALGLQPWAVRGLTNAAAAMLGGAPNGGPLLFWLGVYAFASSFHHLLGASCANLEQRWRDEIDLREGLLLGTHAAALPLADLQAPPPATISPASEAPMRRRPWPGASTSSSRGGCGSWCPRPPSRQCGGPSSPSPWWPRCRSTCAVAATRRRTASRTSPWWRTAADVTRWRAYSPTEKPARNCACSEPPRTGWTGGAMWRRASPVRTSKGRGGAAHRRSRTRCMAAWRSSRASPEYCTSWPRAAPASAR